MKKNNETILGATNCIMCGEPLGPYMKTSRRMCHKLERCRSVNITVIGGKISPIFSWMWAFVPGPHQVP